MNKPTFPGPSFEYIAQLNRKDVEEREQRLRDLKADIDKFLSGDGDKEVKSMLKATLQKVNLMLKEK